MFKQCSTLLLNLYSSGPSETERFLLRHGFSARAAREFHDLPLKAIQADMERRKAYGQGPGAMAIAWHIDPPAPPCPNFVSSNVVTSAAAAKAQAVALAPPNTTTLDIQYLALDLEEGATPEVALANLAAPHTIGGASYTEGFTNAH